LIPSKGMSDRKSATLPLAESKRIAAKGKQLREEFEARVAAMVKITPADLLHRAKGV